MHDTMFKVLYIQVSFRDVLTVKVHFHARQLSSALFFIEKKEPPGCVGLYQRIRKEDDKGCLQLIN